LAKAPGSIVSRRPATHPSMTAAAASFTADFHRSTPEEVTAFAKRDQAFWSALIKAKNIKADRAIRDRPRHELAFREGGRTRRWVGQPSIPI